MLSDYLASVVEGGFQSASIPLYGGEGDDGPVALHQYLGRARSITHDGAARAAAGLHAPLGGQQLLAVLPPHPGTKSGFSVGIWVTSKKMAGLLEVPLVQVSEDNKVVWCLWSY